MLLAISIRIFIFIHIIKLNNRTQYLVAALGMFELSSRRPAALATETAVENTKRKERTKSVKRAGDDTDAFFNDRPETNFAGAEHEFGWIAVQT